MPSGRFALFFNDTIWLEGIEALPFFRRAAFRVARIAYIVVKGFSDERLNQQAAALTYVSFLSIVPLLAVLFSLAKGFGFQEKIGPWVKETLSMVDPEILDQIIQYVSNTNLAALGTIGFIVLLWTILKTLLNLEKSFNQIWSVNNNRPLYRALSYYLSVVLVVPLLVAASGALMAGLQAKGAEGSTLYWLQTLPGAAFAIGLLAALLPFLITCVAFSMVYAFMVNTNVKFGAAAGGALFASALFNLLQWGYIETQVGISKNAIYGTFASLPVFLVYLFLCWLILLFGCRIAFALQNEDSFRRERVAKNAGARFRTAAGLLILKEVAAAFKDGREAEKTRRIAERLDLPLSFVSEIISILQRAGIVHALRENAGRGYSRSDNGTAPARSLDRITVLEVITALEGVQEMNRMPRGAVDSRLIDVLEKADRAREAALEGITVEDLVEGEKKEREPRMDTD